MKKLGYISFILAIFITCGGSISFASAKFAQINATQEQYCTTVTSICGTASEPMNLLMDFVREMSNAIKTIGTEGNYLGQYVNPDRFNGTVFSPPQLPILSKVERNIEQKLKFGVAALSIFASPVDLGGLKDFGGGTVLLAKNKVFLRDNKLIEALESQVNDKRYELGLGGGWYQTINAANLALMQKIITSYIDKGLFLEGSAIKEGTLYNNITSLAVGLLSAAKSFLYFDSTAQFDSISRGGLEGVSLIFDPLAIQRLKFDYTCAQGPYYVCSSESKKFKDNIKKIQAIAKNGTSDAWGSAKKTILDAVARLGKLFSKDPGDDFKMREAELLTSMYGTTKVTPGLLFGNPGKITVSQTNGNAQTLADAGKGAVDAAKAIASGTVRSWSLITQGIQAKKEEIQKISQSNLFSDDSFSTLMNDYLNDVFVNQSMDVELATFSEVKDITPAFALLGKQIEVVKNDILGSKDKEGSLVESLGKACELQCGNIGKCR